MIGILKSAVACIFCCIFGYSAVCAQNIADEFILVPGYENGPVLPDLSNDMGYILSSPARINQSNLNVLAGFSILTAGIMLGVDTPVYHEFKDSRISRHNLLAAPGRFYDRVDPALFALGTTGLMIGSGYFLNDHKLVKTGWTAVEAVLFTQLTTGILKSTIGRKRPFMEQGNLQFEPVDFDDGNPYRSFPSGHTSKIFALSTVIASSYDSPWIRIPAYGLAGSVALQRIESGDHWVSDVVVGGALGYVMGRALAKRNGLISGSSKVLPVVQGGLVGFNVQF